MSNITLDLTNYKSAFGDYIDPGQYLLQVTDVEQNESRAGAPQLQVYYTVMDGDFKGQTLVERYPLDPTSRALFRTVNFLSGLGIPTPKKRIALNPRTLIGRRVNARVEDNEWQGNVSSQIASFMRIRKSKGAAEVDLDDVAAGTETVEVVEEVEEVEDPWAETSDSLDLDLDDIEI